MTAQGIIEHAAADGVRLQLTTSGDLRVSGEATNINRWVSTVRANKATLVSALREWAEFDRLERAAIMEFDGGLSREEAERRAGVRQ